MSVDFHQLAAAHYSNLPSIKAPKLTNAQFEQAVSLATKLKFGGIAEAHEAEMFWHEFSGLQKATNPPITAAQFSEAVDSLARLSFVYHDRPPTMGEIASLHDKSPQQQRDFYGRLPDKYHPDLTAHEMVAAMAKASPYAQQHLGRDPNRVEARFIHHSNMGPDLINTHYQTLATDRAAKMGEPDTGAVQDPSATGPAGGQNPPATPKGAPPPKSGAQ